VRLGTATLDEAGEHDNDMHLIFPDHSPKVVEGGGNGSLRGDVHGISCATHKVGIDVVGAILG
jgi:hypothetical protein